MNELSFTPDWLIIAVAAYAAIVSTAALALEVRRWVESRPRLYLSVMPVGKMVGHGVTDEKEYIVVNVTNRGFTPTTITHLSFQDYENWFNWFRFKPKWAAIVPKPEISGSRPSLPKLLQPGEVWTGMARYDEDGEIARRRDRGFLYVAISATHADKPVLMRVRKPTVPEETDERATQRA